MTNDVTADRSWTVADMADGTLTTVKAGRGGTATSNTFEFDAVQYIVGYGTDVASLSFATSRERQLSGDITSALTNGDRYVDPVYSAVECQPAQPCSGLCDCAGSGVR